LLGGEFMHKKIVVLLLALFFLAMAGLSIWQVQEKGGPAAAYGPDTVGVIEINGAISAESPTNLFGSAGASSDDIMDAIKTAREREDIKVLLLRINSPGGTAVASQEIGIELDKLRSAGKKVVVSMGEVCASGGYWIACSSDHIVANGGSLTGSIGVIMELTNIEGLYEKLGLQQEVIKSAPHKDIGSSYRDMTPEERKLLQDIVDDSYEQFLDQVRRGRRGKIEEDKLMQIADGRIFSGRMGLEMGLVDSLGNYYDAIDVARSIAGLDSNSRIEVLNGSLYWDQSEKELRQARIALKQAQQELSSRELEQGRVMTEKKLLSRSLQEEKAAYAKLDQQYQEKLGHSGLKLPDKDTTLYIKKLLQELQSSIAGLKTTIAQLEEKQEKERELKTSLESMKTAVLEAERICQQRVTEHTVSLHQEEEAGRMAGAIQDELHALQREIMLELAPYGIDPLQMPDVDSIKKQLKQRQEAWIRQEKRKERLEQEIRLMDQVIKQQEMQLKNNYKEQEDLGCKLEKSEESHKRLKQSRLDLYGVRNPDDEEARIQDQLASSEKELDLAKEDFMARDSHLKQMQEQLEELQAGIEERKPLLVQREEEFRLNLKSYGFTDEKDYMLACLPEDEQRQLVQQVDELSREETELQTRCHDKRKALKAEKEKQQSEYSREELELELSQCEKVLEELDKSIITAQLKLENNQSKQGRLKAKNTRA
jgi:protease-4